VCLETENTGLIRVPLASLIAKSYVITGFEYVQKVFSGGNRLQSAVRYASPPALCIIPDCNHETRGRNDDSRIGFVMGRVLWPACLIETKRLLILVRDYDDEDRHLRVLE